MDDGIIIVRNNYRMFSGLKKRQYEYYILDTSPAEGQEEAFVAIETFTDMFINGDNPSGLLLIGGVGSGKTLMVSSVVNYIINSIPIPDSKITGAKVESTPSPFGFWFYSRPKTPVQFISVADLMNQLKECFNDPEAGLAQKITERLQSVELLILDDMGAEKTSDWVQEKLFEIIDYRYNEWLPMLITTNCTPDELKKQIGARNFDRIREMCALVPVTAKSQRQTATINNYRII